MENGLTKSKKKINSQQMRKMMIVHQKKTSKLNDIKISRNNKDKSSDVIIFSKLDKVNKLNEIKKNNYNNNKSELILYNKELSKVSNVPMFLSLMTNQKNYLYSLDNKFKLKQNLDDDIKIDGMSNNNNSLIKKKKDPILRHISSSMNNIFLSKNDSNKGTIDISGVINNNDSNTINFTKKKYIFKNILSGPQRKNQSNILLSKINNISNIASDKDSKSLTLKNNKGYKLKINHDFSSFINKPPENVDNKYQSIANTINHILKGKNYHKLKNFPLRYDKERKILKPLFLKQLKKFSEIHSAPDIKFEKKNSIKKNYLEKIVHSYAKNKNNSSKNLNFNSNIFVNNKTIVENYELNNISNINNLVVKKEIKKPKVKRNKNVKEKILNKEKEKKQNNLKLKNIIVVDNNKNKNKISENNNTKKKSDENLENNIIEKNMFLNLIIPKKSSNDFLISIEKELFKKTEKIYNNIKSSKLKPLENKPVIHPKKYSKLVIDVSNDINKLKKKIFISRKYFYNFNIHKYEISQFILNYKYFQKMNLKYIFESHILNKREYSNIYLTFGKKKLGLRRKSNINIENNYFIDDLKISLKYGPLSKYNSYLIHRFIHIDIGIFKDTSENDFPEDKIEITSRKNNNKLSLNNKILSNKHLSLKLRKMFKHRTVISSLTQSDDNKNTDLNNFIDMFSLKRFSIKKKEFKIPGILDKKNFFDVPRKTIGNELNSIIKDKKNYNELFGKLLNKKNSNDDNIENEDKYNIILKLIKEGKVSKEDIKIKNPAEQVNLTIEDIKKINNNQNEYLSTINFENIKDMIGKKDMEEILRTLIYKGKDKIFYDYILKYKKIDINCTDENGNTFLILAVKQGSPKIVKLLLGLKANINIRNNKGNTALHYATGYKMYKMIDLLKKYGADENILNINGLNPWECFGNLNTERDNPYKG